MKTLFVLTMILGGFNVGQNAFSAEAKKQKMEMATFAAGCFWGTEEFFRKIPGVMSTRVGYAGGTTANPKYKDMHDGHTKHAESVEIEFDPKKVSYEFLLDQFFKMHDPTTQDRQGNDVGNQYRSAIFFHGKDQEKLAKAFQMKVHKSGAWKGPIVTEIAAAGRFWAAEEEHQKYLVKHPGGYDNHHLRKISFDSKWTQAFRVEQRKCRAWSISPSYWPIG